MRRRRQRRQDLRQPAQCRGRIAAAEGCARHRQPALALPRPRLGRGERRAGGHAVRDDAAIADWGVPVSPLLVRCASVEDMLAHYRGIGAQARRLALRYRRRGLQGRPARLAGAAGLRRQGAALGAGAQVPRRARRDHARGDRHPGRPHRQADAGRAAAAGAGRRGHRHQRHAAQPRRDRPAGPAAGRPGGAAARRRRHPAGGREPDPRGAARALSASPIIAPNAAARRWPRRARSMSAAPAG